MRACCHQSRLGAWDPLDPMLQPGIPALAEDYQRPGVVEPRPESRAWSNFVRSIMAADEAAWQKAEQAAKESAPAARGILEFLRANKTAVYVTAGGLFLLALMRRPR